MQPGTPEISTCPNCGGVLEETSSAGLGCLSCLLRAALAAAEKHGFTI
jgi:hypothetical protein